MSCVFCCVTHAKMTETMNEFGLKPIMWLNYFDGLNQDVKELSYYKSLTEKQRKQFESLEGKYFTNDAAATFLRFMYADKFNEKLVMRRLKKALRWHSEMDLGITPLAMDEFNSIRLRGFLGYDKRSLPVFAERVAFFLSKANSSSLTEVEMLRCLAHDMGHMICKFRECAMAGRPVWKSVVIYDLMGLELTTVMSCSRVLKKMAKMADTYFPEQAENIFIINAPATVTMMWAVAKTVVDAETIKKVRIFSGIPTEELLEIMDEDVLYKEYGGKNEKQWEM